MHSSIRVSEIVFKVVTCMLMLDSQCKRCDDCSLNQKSVGESRKDKVHWVILSGCSQCFQFPSMLCLCCLGYGKGVWLVETCFRYPKYSAVAQPTATRGKRMIKIRVSR